MKYILVNFFLFIAIACQAQDLTGTWEGEFGSGTSIPGRRTSFMHMELKQEGRKIAGIFYYGPSAGKKMDMMFEISGEFGKKKPFPFRLIRGEILSNGIDYFESSRFLQFENIYYLKKDTAEILYGKWVSEVNSANGTAGGFKVQKIAATHLLLDKQNAKK